MDADYSLYMKSIATWALTFFGYIISVLASVARPLFFLHASLHYSAGSLASLILPKKVQNLTPREVTLLDHHYYEMSNFIRHNNDKREDKKMLNPISVLQHSLKI